MARAANSEPDLRLVLHDTLSDSYEMSRVLLARAGRDGTLELLTAGWRQVLGYGRDELGGHTLLKLMWSNRRTTARAVAAILDESDLAPVVVRIRCRNGRAKRFRLHRHYHRTERRIYIVAEEIAAPARKAARAG
jgi:PAS domain S-box-containing protein